MTDLLLNSGASATRSVGCVCFSICFLLFSTDCKPGLDRLKCGRLQPSIKMQHLRCFYVAVFDLNPIYIHESEKNTVEVLII